MKLQGFYRTSGAENQRGMALVLVMGLIVLCTVLVVAFFFVVKTEGGSVRSAAAKSGANQLAYSAVQIIEGTISHATDYRSDTTFAWACQPGMIRTYGTGSAVSSAPLAYYKLYSSNQMVVSGSALSNFTFESDVDTNWNSEPACFTDLNAPILSTNGSSGSSTIFPIVDPRAMDLGVQGFNYSSSFPSGKSVMGVSNSTGSLTKPSDSRRLPMPVRWIYVLRDGTMVGPDTGGKTVASFRNSSIKPSASNPIVGRVAFWTDDECGKINVNTASEGTFWDTPICASTFSNAGPDVTKLGEAELATYLPSKNEFQRYGGHPATTCLSPVFGEALGSNLSHSELVKTITALVPRIDGSNNSSQGGKVQGGNVSLTPSANRLYANIDEFAFSATSRTAQQIGSTTSAQFAQSCRFFLTANSRAPELNLFGLPRISMWPIFDDVKQNSRTAFDQAMLKCSTIGSQTSKPIPMIFCREKYGNASYDYDSATLNGVTQNKKLYQYLQHLTSLPEPGYGGATFNTKYKLPGPNGGTDIDQILTEMFDYIRCTNLVDQSEGTTNNSYTNTLALGKPFTNSGDTGQVVPIKIGSTQGFGRIATIAEIGLVLVKIDDRIDDGYKENDVLVAGPPKLLNLAPTLTVTDHGSSVTISPANGDIYVEWALVPNLFCPSAGFPYLANNLDISFSNLVVKVNGVSQTVPAVPPLFELGQIPSSGTSNGTAGGGSPGVSMLVEKGINPTCNFPTGLFSVAAKSPGVPPASFTIEVSGTVDLHAPANSGNLVQTIPFHFIDSLGSPLAVPVPSLAYYSSKTSQWAWQGTIGGTNTFFYPKALYATKPATYTYPAALNTSSYRCTKSTIIAQGNVKIVTTTTDPVTKKVTTITTTTAYQDTVRSLVPAGPIIAGRPSLQGDFRQTALAENIPVTAFLLSKRGDLVPAQTGTSPTAGDFLVHSMNAFGNQNGLLFPIGGAGARGYTTGATQAPPQIPAGLIGVTYDNYTPTPKTKPPGLAFGDFDATEQNRADWDNGIGDLGDGPYINKPDEGFPTSNKGLIYLSPNPPSYYNSNLIYASPAPFFFSPYRQISSPVMFGSLSAGFSAPWRTLLFRPASLLEKNFGTPPSWGRLYYYNSRPPIPRPVLYACPSTIQY